MPTNALKRASAAGKFAGAVSTFSVAKVPPLIDDLTGKDGRFEFLKLGAVHVGGAVAVLEPLNAFQLVPFQPCL